MDLYLNAGARVRVGSGCCGWVSWATPYSCRIFIFGRDCYFCPLLVSAAAAAAAAALVGGRFVLFETASLGVLFSLILRVGSATCHDASFFFLTC